MIFENRNFSQEVHNLYQIASKYRRISGNVKE